jgi:hypothetical protein
VHSKIDVSREAITTYNIIWNGGSNSSMEVALIILKKDVVSS